MCLRRCGPLQYEPKAKKARAAAAPRAARERAPIEDAQVVDPDSLLPPRPGAAAVALVAGRVGTTRLLDNVFLPARR